MTFEYATLELDESTETAYLARAGALGWEAFSVVPGENGKRTFYLKRLASRPTPGSATSNAMATGAGAAGFVYFESGPDLDADGRVDGGLLDQLGDLFS